MIVNIKYVNQPGPQSSGKYGSIVGQAGEKIFVPVDMLGEFQAGTTVDVRTKEQNWGGPDPVTVVAGRPTVPVQGQGAQTGYQRPANNQAPYRPNTGFQPRVVEGGPVGMPAGTDQARHIYVTGIVGRAMGSGKFTASEIAVLTSEANRAFDLIGKPPRVTDAYAEPPLGMEPGDPGPELQ